MKGEPDLRAAALNRLRREREATGAVSNESVRHAAHMLGLTPRQIRRLLARKESARRTAKPRFELTDHHIDVLFSVGGIATEAWKALDEAGEKPDTTLRTFHRRVSQIDPALRATASHGWVGAINRFTYASKHAPYRGHTYCIDHTVLPVPVVAYRGSKEWFYPWGSIVWDESTRLALSGDAYDHDPQSETTRDILLAAFEGFDLDDGTPAGGTPENVLSDRGSDLISEMNGLGLIRAGIGRKFSPPRESYQNGLAEKGLDLFQKEFCRKQPGWVPGKRDSHQRSHPVDLDPDSLLTLDQFRALFAKELHRWNEQRPHSSLGGQTPAQAWAADDHVVPAADPAALRLAMLKSDTTAKIGKKGVRFRDNDYFHPTKLRLHFGKTVEVRYLPRRPDFIEVYYNGQHLCRATLRNAQSDQALGEMTADRKAVKSAFNAHALAGARIAAERANQRLREMGFIEDELPNAPRARGGAKPGGKAPAAGPRVTDEDLDRLDERLGLGGPDHDDHDEGGAAAATGTDGP